MFNILLISSGSKAGASRILGYVFSLRDFRVSLSKLTVNKGVEYLFPIDKPELDRQRMQAYVLKWAFGRYRNNPSYDFYSFVQIKKYVPNASLPLNYI